MIIILIIFDYIKLGVEHNYYRVTTEAFNLSLVFIKTISNVNSNKQHHDVANIEQITKDIYTLLLPKLKLNNADQELKPSVIAAAGNLVMYLGVYLSSD